MEECNSLASTQKNGFLSVVILGASDDLSKSRMFPAVFNLYCQGFLLFSQLKIFGNSKVELSDELFKDQLRAYLKKKEKALAGKNSDIVDSFLGLVTYISGPFDGEKGFIALNEAISHGEQAPTNTKMPTCRLFYLSFPPSVYPGVCRLLHRYCMSQGGWTRFLVEKPFGKDLASVEDLNKQLAELFTEQQLYRIDHFLGKEIAQNLLVMRFANTFILPIWNRDNIANVQIVSKEKSGIEGRGGYFDEYGIIRDMIQSHLIQVLCLLAMEKPVSLSPEHIRNEKVKVLKAIEPLENKDVVLGQYDTYRENPTIPHDSKTPTFAAIVLRINSERWDGVPFILRAGKALDSCKVEIRVQFKAASGDFFNCKNEGRNELVMRLHPSEAMYLKLTVKQPGLEMAATQSELDLSYQERYQNIPIPEAYEHLLLAAIRGDQQHFIRRDELHVGWKIFAPILHQIEDGKIPIARYKNGSRGPLQAEELIAREGFVRTSGYVWIPSSSKRESKI